MMMRNKCNKSPFFPFCWEETKQKKTKSWNGLRRLDGSLYFETIYDHVCEVYICMYTYVLLDKLIHGTTLYDLYVGRPAIYIGCNSFTYLFLLYAAVRVVSQPVISTLWIVASLIKIQACGVWFKSFEGNAQSLSVDRHYFSLIKIWRDDSVLDIGSKKRKKKSYFCIRDWLVAMHTPTTCKLTCSAPPSCWAGGPND